MVGPARLRSHRSTACLVQPSPSFALFKMSQPEVEGNLKMAALFEKYKHTHRLSYPGSEIDFETLDLTKVVTQTKVLLIGRGLFSDVYKETLEANKVVAVKVLRRPIYDTTQDEHYENFMRRFFRELNHWRILQHANIAQMLGFTLNDGDIGFVSLWYTKGNLLQFLKANPAASKPDLTLDVADGLQYLHNNHQPLIHGDLKGVNVFIGEDEVACLGDFGISKLVDDLHRTTGFTTFGGAGTIPWMAPELLQGENATLASDIYSFAAVMVEIWCPGNFPFHYLAGQKITKAKAQGLLPEQQHYPEIPSDQLWGSMCSCWSKTPEDRPNIDDVRKDLHNQFNLLPRGSNGSGAHPRASCSLAPTDLGVEITFEIMKPELLNTSNISISGRGQPPANHSLQIMSYHNMANALMTQFEQQGNTGDLDQAITYHQQALDLCPPSHPNCSSSLNKLASALKTRFEQQGDTGDLDQAITYYQQALDLCPPGHPRYSAYISNLASALQAWFQQQGNMGDLDQAITYHQQALDLRPSGHPDRSSSLNKLASALKTRFEQQGDTGDLDQAIAYHQQALDLRPLGHPRYSAYLNNLASALQARFRWQRNTDDLDQAITYHQQALDLRPSGHPHYSTYLNNLASALQARFQQQGNTGDLDQAITYHQQALDLRPSGHPRYSAYLNNLASALLARFRQHFNMGDLDQAITYYQQALNLRPTGHPDHFITLNNLAHAFETRFQQCGNKDDLDQATAYRQQALDQ